MASTADEVPPTQANEVESSSIENKISVENEESKQADKSEPAKTDEPTTEVQQEQTQAVTTMQVDSNENVLPNDVTTTKSDADEVQKKSETSDNVKNVDIVSNTKQAEPTAAKPRSVKLSSNQDDTEVTKPRSTNSSQVRTSHMSSRTSRRPIDFIDALVESYKLETSNTVPIKEEKKYVPRTNHTRVNPNWREHRTRRLMNKLEELSLWDREEELKVAQAQALRDQKWEQIQDRQRNNDLCLNLMRQRHESEMESAVTLDRGASGVNDENTSATIARTLHLAKTTNNLSDDISIPPATLKRRLKQEQEQGEDIKTPIGRYRQFEANMSNKIEKINQKLQPDHEIMRAYNPSRTSIPTNSVPLFSETYSTLLAVPDTGSSNKYNQYHYGVASYLHQPPRSSTPDYEIRTRPYSSRDSRIPLKEHLNDYNYYNDKTADDYNRSNGSDDDYSPKYRSTSNGNSYYTKPHSSAIDDDYYPKYRSTSNDNSYNTKSHSSAIDDDYYPKRRLNFSDEDNIKVRLNSGDDDYYSKRRSHLLDEDQPKYRLSSGDDDFYPKRRLNTFDDDYRKYRTNPIADIDDDDDYLSKYRATVSSRLDYSPPRRTTAFVSPTASALYDCSTVTNTPREYSFIHARQPISNNIHLRSLNDDLNALTGLSPETSKRNLHNAGDSSSDLSIKSRLASSSAPTSKHMSLKNRDFDDDDFNFNSSSHSLASKTAQRPIEIISLSSTR